MITAARDQCGDSLGTEAVASEVREGSQEASQKKGVPSCVLRGWHFSRQEGCRREGERSIPGMGRACTGRGHCPRKTRDMFREAPQTTMNKDSGRVCWHIALYSRWRAAAGGPWRRPDRRAGGLAFPVGRPENSLA